MKIKEQETQEVFKVTSSYKETKNNKKKQKQQKPVFVEKYAELFNGTLVKITHEYSNGMYIGDVLSEFSEKCIGTLYFPKSYIKSFEEISVK
jgi:hypothetical protein